MNMNKTKVMFNGQLTGQQTMIGNKMMERVEAHIYIYIYLGPKSSANSTQKRNQKE